MRFTRICARNGRPSLLLLLRERERKREREREREINRNAIERKKERV